MLAQLKHFLLEAWPDAPTKLEAVALSTYSSLFVWQRSASASGAIRNSRVCKTVGEQQLNLCVIPLRDKTQSELLIADGIGICAYVGFGALTKHCRRVSEVFSYLIATLRLGLFRYRLQEIESAANDWCADFWKYLRSINAWFSDRSWKQTPQPYVGHAAHDQHAKEAEELERSSKFALQM